MKKFFNRRAIICRIQVDDTDSTLFKFKNSNKIPSPLFASSKPANSWLETRSTVTILSCALGNFKNAFLNVFSSVSLKPSLKYARCRESVFVLNDIDNLIIKSRIFTYTRA